MSRVLRLPGILLLSLLSLAGQAQQLAAPDDSARSAGEHFSAGSDAFNRGDYARALSEFEAAIRAGSPGPAAHYNAAVCHYRLGDYAAAATAFRQLASDYPQMQALADYNLGLSLVHLNRTEQARAAFLRATSADDEQTVTLAHAMLARLRGAQADGTERPRIGLIDFNFGHDDNVALIDPLGLPAGQSTDSPFAELSFYFGGPVLASGHWTFYTTTFFLDYADAEDFNQSGLNLGLTHGQPVGRWTLSVGPRFGRTYVDGDGFEETFGVSARLRRSLGPTRAVIELELSHDVTDELEPRFEYIGGDRDQFSARLDKDLGRVRFVADYRIRRDDRAGAGVSADSETYRVSLRRGFTPRWLGDLTLEYRDTEYERLNPTRHEQRTQTRIRVTRQLDDDWRLVTEYMHTDNDSSDNAFTYGRQRFSIGASKSF